MFFSTAQLALALLAASVHALPTSISGDEFEKRQIQKRELINDLYKRVASTPVYLRDFDPNAMIDGKLADRSIVLSRTYDFTPEQRAELAAIEKRFAIPESDLEARSSNPAQEARDKISKRDDNRWNRSLQNSEKYEGPHWVPQSQLYAAKDTVCSQFSNLVSGVSKEQARCWWFSQQTNSWHRFVAFNGGPFITVFFRYLDNQGFVWDRCYDSFFDLIWNKHGRNPDSAGGYMDWYERGVILFPKRLQRSDIWTRSLNDFPNCV